MSVSGYSRIERDEVKITYDKLERIASILKVPVTEIVNHQEAVNAKNVAHSNEHPIAANNHNQSVEIEKLETLYREQIISLREEVAYLRELLKKTMEK